MACHPLKSQLLNGHHLSLHQQQALLTNFMLTIECVPHLLNSIQTLPGAWIGAGLIYQNVWNAMHDYPMNNGIKDIDILYWDPNDTSWDAEDQYIRQLTRQLAGSPLPVDVKNIARVHLWYQQRFGITLEPYGSVQESVASWPVLGAAIAMRQTDTGIEFTAPYGFHDMFMMRLRPNKGLVTREVYEAKVQRWQHQWPMLSADAW